MLLSIADARRLLPTLGIKVQGGSDHADFRSQVFGTWKAPPPRVEFMAGFCYRTGTRWPPVEPATRERIAVGDVAVFVPDRKELSRILRGFGRPKDIDRADRLARLDD